jgi:glycosyltransferase involved in cell wall biosynthesis
VDEKAVQPVEKSANPLFEEFGLSRDKFTVVYAGNLGNAQNIGIVLDGVARLPEVQFALFGTGGLESEIRTRIEMEGLTNVHLNPLQPVERVSYVYSLGDACIVSCKEGLGGSAMPSKSWSIMSCGRPVIASFDEGELKEILEKNKSSYKPVAQLDDYGHEIKRYNTTKEASIAMNVSVSAISACIRGKSKHAAGYKWKHLY